MDGDKAYEAALQKRAKLLQELENIEQFLRMYDHFATGRPLKKSSRSSDVGTLRSDSAGTSRRVAGRSPSKEKVAEAAREILLAHGKPMTRAELLDNLDSRGLVIVGTNRVKNMGTMMWRLRDQFVNIEGYGYWPKDMECDEVGYRPERESLRFI